eukprot:6488559-Pyramimonas_sp.AAC.1
MKEPTYLPELLTLPHTGHNIRWSGGVGKGVSTCGRSPWLMTQTWKNAARGGLESSPPAGGWRGGQTQVQGGRMQ